jgi:ArsR family transcriptional regulator
VDEPYEAVASVAKAFAHRTRLRIVSILAREEACVCHLTAILDERQAHVSQHLRVLKDAALVSDRREGQMIYYRLADGRAAMVASLLRDLTQQTTPGLVFTPIPAIPVPGCPCPRCSASSCCQDEQGPGNASGR